MDRCQLNYLNCDNDISNILQVPCIGIAMMLSVQNNLFMLEVKLSMCMLDLIGSYLNHL